jgi:hypothetical protein
VRVRRLARDDFSWADAIPELAGTGPVVGESRGPDRDRVA